MEPKPVLFFFFGSPCEEIYLKDSGHMWIQRSVDKADR